MTQDLTTTTPTVIFFEELTAEQASHAGGKGSALARLVQAGHPVPPGFILLTSAFEGDDLTPPAREELAAALEQLRAGQPARALAVRSSAVGEDSERASFAGEFETVLDVREDDALHRAIATVRRSRHAPRVAAYREAQGLTGPSERLVAGEATPSTFTLDRQCGTY